MKKFVATVFAAVFAFTALSETAVDYVKTKTWCSLGTSITDFNDVPTTGRTKGYQYFLMDKLGWDRAKLTDSGHSGTLVSSSSSKPPDTPCDIYTVEYGVNDWGKGHPVGTLDDYTNYLYNDRAVRWNNFASCYRNLIEMIRKVNPGAIIILITPRKAYGSSTDAGTKMFPPACDDPTLADSVDDYYDPSQGSNVHGDQTYLKDYADLIKAIGEYEGFPVVDWYADAASQDNLASRSVDVAVHPNDAGYEIMADLLAPKILEAVAAQMGGDPADPAGAKLTLNPNGGTVSSATVSLPAAALPTPTRTGYHFVGWFEDKTLTSYDYTPGGSYVPGTFLYGTPVTAPSADYADKTLYAKWVKTSVYEHFHGKKVAVYGDSVSTLLGFVPSAEAEMFNGGVFYGQDYVDKGINEHTHWWGQLVDALGMELLQVNAIGGSSVGAYAYEYGLERKAMMNYTRMCLLDDAGTPDVILVAAGINDYNDSTTGFNANADYLTGDLDRVTSICPDFAKAYALMIRRLQDLYPDAEIVALSSFDVGAATATETGNNCIRRTCALYNVVNIDMRDAFTLNDGTGVNYRPHGIHPGISGFAAIANCFLENYAPIANPVVVPDCGHTWGFGVLTTPATATTPGVRTYTCRHCSATRTEAVPYVALSEGTEADITSQATVKGVYLLPDDRQVMANTVDKQATPLASYNGYLESPDNLIDGKADTIYKDWIMNDRYIAFTFDQPMVVTSVRLLGVMNRYPNKIQIVDPDNRLLGKTDNGIPYTSGQHQCTITTTERVATSELRLAVDFDYVGKEFQLKEVAVFGYAAGEEPPPDNPPEEPVEIVDVVALRNIAVATAVGTAPTLPEKVAGLKADGTLAGEYDVVWPEVVAPSAAGITTITGAATVNGTAMTVTASVRAAAAGEGDTVNVSPSSTLTSTDPQGAYFSEVISADEPNPDSSKWMTVLRTNASDMTNTLTWDESKTISKVRIAYSGHQNHSRPATVDFSTGTASILAQETSRDTVGAHLWIEYTFSQPIAVSTLLCHFTRGGEKNSILVERVWAYEVQSGGTVKPQTTDTLMALEVDNKAVTGFAPTTLDYEVTDGQAITKATNDTDNVAVTILPKNVDDNAYAVTLAENGSTKKYTVAMSAEEEPPIDPPVEVYTLTLDPKGGTVASTTVDLPALSLPTPTREGHHFVGWFKDEIDANTTQGYVRGRYLCGEPLKAATADDKDKILYAKWVKNEVYNHFKGKKAVFVGDSVSTLHGFAAKDRQLYTANIFYSESTAAANGITAQNTWWGQLVQALDMDLLSVNAVSGSPVTDSEPSITYDVRAMSGTVRINDLDVKGAPEVIFIFGGINDFNGNTKAPIDDYDPNASYLTDTLDLASDYFPTFAEGYATMLRRMRHYYPDAEIVAIGPYLAASDRDGYKPVFVKGNATISNLCARFDVPYLNLMNTQLPYWANGVRLLCDSYHPNQAGFTEFANYVLENFEPACAHANKTELTEAVAATCTTDGYSGDCMCTDCGKEFPGHVITKLGHLWSDWATTKEPTKTEPGYREHTCQREGCGVTEGEVIPKLADVVALRNVAVATAVGAAPTLPAKVAGLKADGTLGDEYEVSWNPVEAPVEEGVTTVSGTATVDGQPMTVTASVRAVAADPVNHSSSAISTEPSNIVKGTINNNSKLKYLTTNATDPLATDNIWNDVICYGNIVEVTLEWSSEVSVTKVKVYFNGTTGNYMAPKNVKFYTGDDFADEIEYDDGDNNDLGGNEAWHEYVFKAPQTLSKIKFYQQSDKTNTNKMLFLRRLWVQGVGSVDPSSTDTLTALEVDGKAVTGFAPETFSYEVTDGQAITKAENGTDNVAVTILPKYNYKAYAVTLAEDGESTKTYTVSMPKSHDHVFGEWQVITPATVYAPGLRRRVCTFAGCEVKEEEEIPQIPRKKVKWVDVDFANYTDGSAIANGQVDPVNGGTWAKPSADDTATVAHGDPDPDLAALVVTNQYLCYAAKAQTLTGRDATVEFTAKFQKPNTDELPQALDLGQTAVFVFPKGKKESCYKAYTADGWVELEGATPDFENFVTITTEFRYNDGGRSAKVTIDGAECTPVGAASPWFSLAGEATKLTSVSFFGEFDLGNFWGEYLTIARGLMLIFQ